MIKLFTFPAGFGLPTLTPFGLKLIAYLKLAGLPFEIVYKQTPRGTPKSKLPYIVDDDGSVLADSGLIIEHLEKKHGGKLDGWLDAQQRATAHLLRRTFEESLYWVHVYSRWVDPEFWDQMRDGVFASLPFVARGLVPGIARGMTRKQIVAQGYGRHSRDEIYAMGALDIDAIATTLGDKPWFVGDRPSTIDATAYGFLSHTLDAPFETPLKAAASKRPNLRAFLDRFAGKYLGDR